jgi:hypothetical protein
VPPRRFRVFVAGNAHGKLPRMTEPKQLLSAREHLAKAESMYRSENGLFYLEEGLALLEELIDDAPSHRAVARNLAATYAMKLYGCVKNAIDHDRGIPEPELEHYFKVVLAFDQGDFALPAEAREVKIGIAKRLIERYYEGHSEEVKRKALEKLSEISSGRKP